MNVLLLFIGKGEMFMRSVAAYDISARMQYGGHSLQRAAHDAIHCGAKSTAAASSRIAGACPNLWTFS